jgi:RND family efflux transporter MFP subunit
VKTATVTRGDVRQVLTVPGQVSPAQTQDMGFSAGGRLTEIDVLAGDQVTEGQTLAKIDSEPLKIALAQAQVDYQVKLNELNTLKSSSPVTATDLMQAQVAAQTSQDALKQAEADLTGATMLAPFAGRVLTVSGKLGDTVAANAAVFELADLNRLQVQTTVGQEDVVNVKAGQVVSLTFDAISGKSFSGKVSRIDPTRSSTSGAVTYSVFVSLDAVPPGLLPDMTGDADIVIGERNDVLMLPRRSVRATQNATISVPVLQRGRTLTRSVTFGLVGDTNVEIVSGLQEGDQVVTSQ